MLGDLPARLRQECGENAKTSNMVSKRQYTLASERFGIAGDSILAPALVNAFRSPLS
jgi:hypothetical protein